MDACDIEARSTALKSDRSCHLVTVDSTLASYLNFLSPSFLFCNMEIIIPTLQDC